MVATTQEIVAELRKLKTHWTAVRAVWSGNMWPLLRFQAADVYQSITTTYEKLISCNSTI